MGGENSMKIFHLGYKTETVDQQKIFVASDDSRDRNNIVECLAQISVSKNDKLIQLLLPKGWKVKTYPKSDDTKKL
jgi:hypothetical protein